MQVDKLTEASDHHTSSLILLTKAVGGCRLHLDVGQHCLGSHAMYIYPVVRNQDRHYHLRLTFWLKNKTREKGHNRETCTYTRCSIVFVDNRFGEGDHHKILGGV